jgi:hypothetical protein
VGDNIQANHKKRRIDRVQKILETKNKRKRNSNDSEKYETKRPHLNIDIGHAYYHQMKEWFHFQQIISSI